MELLLADKLGFPKGFNGFEWSSLPTGGVKKSQMPSYLVEDLPNTDGFSIRDKFKEVSFAEAPKIGYFNPFIKSNYEIFRKQQLKKQKITELRKKKKDDKYMKKLIQREELKQYSVDNYGSTYQEITPNKLSQQIDVSNDRFYSVTPTASSKPNNTILNLLKEKMQQERKEKKELETKKQQLIDDLHYYKIFADKCSRLTIECVDSISKMIGENEENPATDQDEVIDHQRDSMILNPSGDNFIKKDILSPQLNSLSQPKGSIQYSVQKDEEDDNTVTKKLSQYNANNTLSVFPKSKNNFRPHTKAATTSLYSNQKGSKPTNFLEEDMTKLGVNDQNRYTRGRNNSQFQGKSNEQEKVFSSTAYGNSQYQTKRTNYLNQQSSNKLNDSSITFFKGDETLYNTFLSGQKGTTRRLKNNNSFLQSTAATNKNFQLRLSMNQSLYQNAKTQHNQESQLNNQRATTADIRPSHIMSKTPKAYANTQSMNKNRFLTPQKQQIKLKEEQLQQQTTTTPHNSEMSFNQPIFSTQQINETNHNKFPSNTAQNKRIVYEDNTPSHKMKNNFMSTAKRNFDNYVSNQPIKQKNQETPSREISPNSQHQEDSIILNNMRSKRQSDYENLDSQMDYIDPHFLQKSNIHHKSVMYAMKTLKKKFGIIKDKFDHSPNI